MVPDLEIAAENRERESVKEIMTNQESTHAQILVISEKVFQSLYESIVPKGASPEFVTFQEATEFLKDNRPDLAVIDAAMEPERGLNVLREIKAISFEIPVIFVTEGSSPAVVREAYRSGARDYMEKPININELRNTVETLLEIKKTSKEKRHPFFSKQAVPRDSLAEVTSDKPAYIIRAIRYIEDNLSSKISLGGIAQAANFSKYHFCRIFSRYTGMTPFQFASAMRIRKAKELLAGADLSVSQVASLVGFNDLGTFLRQFKKMTGSTPAKYRSRIRQEKQTGKDTLTPHTV